MNFALSEAGMLLELSRLASGDPEAKGGAQKEMCAVGKRQFIDPALGGSAPGSCLNFLGLHWMHTIKSGLLFGVGTDAEYLAETMDRLVNT